jgi:hypothetical protein
MKVWNPVTEKCDTPDCPCEGCCDFNCCDELDYFMHKAFEEFYSDQYFGSFEAYYSDWYSDFAAWWKGTDQHHPVPVAHPL